MTAQPFIEGTLIVRYGRRLKRSREDFPGSATVQVVSRDDRLAVCREHLVAPRPDEEILLDLLPGVLPPQPLRAGAETAVGHLMLRFGTDCGAATRWMRDPEDHWGGPVLVTRGPDPSTAMSDVGYDPETDAVFLRNALLPVDVLWEEMLSYALTGQPADASRWVEHDYERDTGDPHRR